MTAIPSVQPYLWRSGARACGAALADATRDGLLISPDYAAIITACQDCPAPAPSQACAHDALLQALRTL